MNFLNKTILLFIAIFIGGCAYKSYKVPDDAQKAKIVIETEIKRNMELSNSASVRYLIYADEKCNQFPGGYILGSSKVKSYEGFNTRTFFEGQIQSGKPIILTQSFASTAIDMKTSEYCQISVKFNPINNYTYFSKFLVDPASCNVILTSTNAQDAKETVFVQRLRHTCTDELVR